MSSEKFKVNSRSTRYTKNHIYSLFSYHHNDLVQKSHSIEVNPKITNYIIQTNQNVLKTGLMLVGIGGNNGSTVMAGILANKLKLKWQTKEGEMTANYLGSVTQSATLKIGELNRQEKFVPFNKILPLLDPNDLIISGWDINSDNMFKAMTKAKVLHKNLQTQLEEKMSKILPLPGIYYKDFIALNQKDRANNILEGDRACTTHLRELRRNIRDFKSKNQLNNVIVLWTANTERFCDVTEGIHDTEENLLKAIENGHREISPSQIFAMASIQENCSFINGSPQNTLVPGIRQAAERQGVFVAGDDFKSGQTKIKSVLVDFLVSAGLRPESIVSYNHLGNNDGRNLSSPKQFDSKRITKSNVVDDVVASNPIIYHQKNNNKPKGPDHCVVIKYVPFVGDSKRAMDEYISSIFLNGRNTLVLHNTCEDSLLAAPIIIDLVILTELFQRIKFLCLPTKFGTSEDIEKGKSVKENGFRKRIKCDLNVMEMSHHNGKDNFVKNGNKNSTYPSEDLGIIKELMDLASDSNCSEIDFDHQKLKFRKMETVLSALSYLLKAPQVPENSPVVNALFRQRSCLDNLFRACLGLQPESDLLLDYKIGGK